MAAPQELFDLDVGLNCGIKWLPTGRLGWSDTALLVLELAGWGEGELRLTVCTAMEIAGPCRELGLLPRPSHSYQ